VILDGVLAQVEALRNLAIAEPFGQAAYNLQFTFREQTQTMCIHGSDRGSARQCVQGHNHFATAGPYLSLVHALNAFAKKFDGLTLAEYPSRAGAKSVQDNFILQRIHQHYGPNSSTGRAQLAQDFKAASRLLIQIGADHKYIGIQASDR
jgi:hypothetical protein